MYTIYNMVFLLFNTLLATATEESIVFNAIIHLRNNIHILSEQDMDLLIDSIKREAQLHSLDQQKIFKALKEKIDSKIKHHKKRADTANGSVILKEDIITLIKIVGSIALGYAIYRFWYKSVQSSEKALNWRMHSEYGSLPMHHGHIWSCSGPSWESTNMERDLWKLVAYDEDKKLAGALIFCCSITTFLSLPDFFDLIAGRLVSVEMHQRCSDQYSALQERLYIAPDNPRIKVNLYV
jgi:hypothetical protein